MGDWKTIESAPKDGTWILAYGLGYKGLDSMGGWITHKTEEPMVPVTLIICWDEHWYDAEVNIGDGAYRKERTLSNADWKPAFHAFRPTHWMPMPAPPPAA